jgi:hypothetical protein
MGMPDLDEIRQYIGYNVKIVFNHDDGYMVGHLTQAADDGVVLDDITVVAWRSIQSIGLV